MRKLNRKTPLVFKIGVLLLCAMLITSYMTSGLYARYSVMATGSDSARVARFSFNSNLDTQVEQMIIAGSSMYPGCSYTTEIYINNTGEVTLRYVVSIENLTENLPIEIQIEGGDTVEPGKTVDSKVIITWLPEKNSVDYAGKMDVINITVTVEQVD